MSSWALAAYSLKITRSPATLADCDLALLINSYTHKHRHTLKYAQGHCTVGRHVIKKLNATGFLRTFGTLRQGPIVRTNASATIRLNRNEALSRRSALRDCDDLCDDLCDALCPITKSIPTFSLSFIEDSQYVVVVDDDTCYKADVVQWVPGMIRFVAPKRRRMMST